MLENIIVNGVTLCSCARSMASCRSMYMFVWPVQGIEKDDLI